MNLREKLKDIKDNEMEYVVDDIPSPVRSYISRYFVLACLVAASFIALKLFGLEIDTGFIFSAVFVIALLIGAGMFEYDKVRKNGFKTYSGEITGIHVKGIGSHKKYTYMIDLKHDTMKFTSLKQLQISKGSFVTLYAPFNVIESNDEGITTISSYYGYSFLKSE